MLTQHTIQHFGLSRNPFRNDICFVDDVYLSVQATNTLVDMCDAIKSGGIISVMGDIDSGKSTLRQLLTQELRQRQEFTIIKLPGIDNTKLTAVGLCEVIVGELSDETPLDQLVELEQQVVRLVHERTQSGGKCVLVIEEAHDLTVTVLGYLNRLWGLGGNSGRLLSILLVGRRCFIDKIDEHLDNPEGLLLYRCVACYLEPFGYELSLYLEHKLKRAGAQFSRLIEVDAIEAIHQRLQHQEGKDVVSDAYPLAVNNLMMRAMNRAAELGEDRVSAEIIRKA